MSGLWLISYVALWVLFLIVAIVLLAVLHNLGVIHQSMVAARQSTIHLANPAPTRLVAGEALPELTLGTLTGEPRALGDFQGAKTAFLVVSPNCSPCHTALKDIATGRRAPDPLDPTVRHVVAVSTGDYRATAELAERVAWP